MRKFGVPDSALLLEERSYDTTTNARYTAAVARANGIQRILLVTSGVHMPRASLLFRGTGIEVFEVPVPEPTIGGSWADRWIAKRRVPCGAAAGHSRNTRACSYCGLGVRRRTAG